MLASSLRSTYLPTATGREVRQCQGQMSPIRRYLRITKFSVLEVRIYLEKPSDAPWLLSSRDPVLPHIIEAVRPQVLPKLREENENSKKRGGKKKKIIKDVVSRDNFEVTIFLTEAPTRHSLLTKQKRFNDVRPTSRSGPGKLGEWLDRNEGPIAVSDDEEEPTGLLREVEDVNLRDIPAVCTGGKRDGDPDPFVVSSDDEHAFQTQRKPPAKRRKVRADDESPAAVEAADDKKNMAMDTTYDGFSIYGRVLCLVVKRKNRKTSSMVDNSAVGRSQMMEHWVSTQAAQEADTVDDDAG